MMNDFEKYVTELNAKNVPFSTGDAYYDATDSEGKYIDVYNGRVNHKYQFTRWYDTNGRFIKQTN